MASWQARTTSFVLRHWFKPRLARTPDALSARKVMSGGPGMPAPRGARTAVPGDCGRDRWRVGDCRRRPDSSDAALPARRRLLRLHAANLSPRHVFVRARGIQDVRSGLSTGARTSVSGGARRRHRRVSRTAAGPRSPRSSWSQATLRAADSAWRCCFRCANVAFRCPPLPCSSRPSSISLRPASLLAPTAAAARCSRSESFGRAAQYYLGDGDRCAPLASPLYADLHGLPPLLIHVGTDETLLDDSRRLAERAQRAGVKTQLKIWPAVPHVWQLFQRWIPEGRSSLREAGMFFAREVGTAGAR